MARHQFALLSGAVALLLGCATQGELPHAQDIVTDTINAIDQVHPQVPPSHKYGEMTVQQAYRIQDLYAARRGEQVGYKIAFASKATQDLWGLDEPVLGPLFRFQQVENRGTVRGDIFTHFRLETELAFVLGRDIEAPPSDLVTLKSMVASVHLAFDLPDKRFGAKPTAADVVATGAGAHRFVLGRAFNPVEVDVDAISLAASKDGSVIYQGPSNAVMGGQWVCLKWAVDHLLARGKKIPAGTIFLSGAVDKPYGAVGVDAKGRYVGVGGAVLGEIEITVE